MITISYLSLACAPWGEEPKHDVLTRAVAASKAGLTSIGVDLSEVGHMRKFTGRIQSLVKVDECEWIDLGTENPYNKVHLDALKFLSQEFGTTRVNVGVCDLQTSAYQAAQCLKRLADDAGQLGMTVAVEPVAFGSQPMIIDVADILSLAGNPGNAGLLFDVWQVSYQSNNSPWSLLPDETQLPVAEIQLAGVTRWDAFGKLSVHVTTRQASQERRSLTEMSSSPLNIKSWLEKFNTANAPLSYEVPRSDWRELDIDEVAALIKADIAPIGG